LIKLGRLERPEPVVRSDMEQRFAIGNGAIERCDIREVPHDDFDRKPLQIAAVGTMADQHSDLPARCREGSGDCRADKSPLRL